MHADDEEIFKPPKKEYSGRDEDNAKYSNWIVHSQLSIGEAINIPVAAAVYQKNYKQVDTTSELESINLKLEEIYKKWDANSSFEYVEKPLTKPNGAQVVQSWPIFPCRDMSEKYIHMVNFNLLQVF